MTAGPKNLIGVAGKQMMGESLEDKEKIQQFTIYLIRKEVRKHGEIFGDLSKLEEPVKIPLRFQDGTLGGTLYFAKRDLTPPKWKNFFGDLLNGIKIPDVRSLPAVLLLPVEERIFAVTFSHGNSLLEPGVVEPSFGLRVALNCLAPGRTRSFDKKSFDALFRQSREQAAKEASLADFGIDAERDLIRGVSGRTKTKAYGTRMSGSDSLSVSAPLTPENLASHLWRYNSAFESQGFLDDYPWIGKIAEERDPETNELLDIFLVETLWADTDSQQVWLAPPEIVDWSTIANFAYFLPASRRDRKFAHTDLDLQQYLSVARKGAGVAGVNNLKKSFIEAVDDSGYQVRRWRIYDCLNAELESDGRNYVLSQGKWYRVDRDLVQDVDDYCNQVPRCNLRFPKYQHASEKHYSKHVADSNPDDMCLMDSNNIQRGDPIELCDILSKSNEFIHLKRQRSSSGLSHLFSQGLISGELFKMDREFREKANQRIPARFKFPSPASIPDSSLFTVVYGIIAPPGKFRLPLFSRINLRMAGKKLTIGYGYKIALAEIHIDEDFFRLQNIRPKVGRKSKSTKEPPEFD
jgi:uncharacterized protein (TIGR04141 family)